MFVVFSTILIVVFCSSVWEFSKFCAFCLALRIEHTAVRLAPHNTVCKSRFFFGEGNACIQSKTTDFLKLPF